MKHNVGALPRELQGDLASNASAGTGHQRLLSL
jgi:hypothetical protein